MKRLGKGTRMAKIETRGLFVGQDYNTRSEKMEHNADNPQKRTRRETQKHKT